jgi:outer membrane protein assembly factor BamD
MAEFLRKNRHLIVVTLGVLLLFGVCGGAGAQNNSKKKKAAQQAKGDELTTSSEPDKVLYDRAMGDIKKGRYTEGRLSLQTLINTYPDSEYLAKSKLAIADSFFKESGTSNLMQAIAEYKDFITFFPFLDEAAYAQMQVGMGHYRMMEKPDRDTSQAQEAEQEFQTMLLKYPQSKFALEAEQRLREVQEILADGEFRIARFYFTKTDTTPQARGLWKLPTATRCTARPMKFSGCSANPTCTRNSWQRPKISKTPGRFLLLKVSTDWLRIIRCRSECRMRRRA